MRICAITTTRAEYGLLYPLLCQIKKDESVQLELVVSGTHLLQDFGNTEQEIINDGFEEVHRINIIGEDDYIIGDASEVMSRVISEFAQWLKKRKPDIAIILGDRYEMMAFAIPLVNERVPIAHINGGEVSGGSLDEIYRHCITKMSTLHFANCEEHKKNIIQMGEQPDNVYNVGDLCVDNIFNTELLDKKELEKLVGISFKNKKIIIVTFHPATMETNSIIVLKNLLEVIKRNSDYFYIFTGANADKEGKQINNIVKEFVLKNENTIFVSSMGRVGYLSALSVSDGVVGNSSSGLYEAPYFKIPTINIGSRQKNRLHGETVLDCGETVDEISKAFEIGLSETYKKKCSLTTNIWGDGNTASTIMNIIKQRVNHGLDVKKSFYQVQFELEEI